MYVIVNIIKLKRMQGLNYLSFGEQRFFFNYGDIACQRGFLLMGRGIVGREGGREGGILCCPFSPQYPAEKS